jgi:site-specific recombinase XerD
MPSKERIKASFIDEFLQSRSEEAGLAPKTISKYRVALTQAVDALDEAELNCYPRKIRKVEINHLRKNHFIENSKSYNRWKLAILGEWLAWYDNKIAEKMRIPPGRPD